MYCRHLDFRRDKVCKMLCSLNWFRGFLERNFLKIITKNLIFTVYLSMCILLSTDNKLLQLITPSMVFIEFDGYRYSPKIMP